MIDTNLEKKSLSEICLDLIEDFGPMTFEDIWKRILLVNQQIPVSDLKLRNIIQILLEDINDRTLSIGGVKKAGIALDPNLVKLGFLLDSYAASLQTYHSFYRIDLAKRAKYSHEIKQAKKTQERDFEIIVSFIIDNSVTLINLKEQCSDSTYEKIISDEKMQEWIQGRNIESNLHDDNESERLREYEVLCKKVWDNGIITIDEEIQLTDKIKELDLDVNKGNEIFEKIKGEYINRQNEKKKPPKYQDIKINNTKFLVKRSSLPFHPLFGYEFNRITGDDILIINISHRLYNENSENVIINFVTALYHTKLSMTDPNVSRFIERISNNLELIENEF